MYLPPHFAETRPETLHRLMQEHPLGMLVTCTADGPDADHLPFAFDASAGPLGTLTAHVARANPVWQRAADQEVLVVFRGVQGYISPNGYPSKHETHRQVPTWNYVVVHARGRLVVRDDVRFLRGLVARLTRHHEAREPQPWRMGDAPADYLDDMLGKIVGLQVPVTALTGKAKLGQNKTERDRLGAAEALAARGHEALAQAMRDAG